MGIVLHGRSTGMARRDTPPLGMPNACLARALSTAPPPPAPRFSYCALLCLSIMGRTSAVDVPAALRFIARCKNFDGGFGCTPGRQGGAGGTDSCARLLHELRSGTVTCAKHTGPLLGCELQACAAPPSAPVCRLSHVGPAPADERLPTPRLSSDCQGGWSWVAALPCAPLGSMYRKHPTSHVFPAPDAQYPCSRPTPCTSPNTVPWSPSPPPPLSPPPFPPSPPPLPPSPPPPPSLL